jgi:DNA-binding GntR family transcriptional regulator
VAVSEVCDHVTAIRKPKRVVTKQEGAYGTIRERILSGAYGPGYRIIIDALAAELGISPLPVREAMRRLEAEGLIVFRANAGAQVVPAEPAQFEEKMTVLAILGGYASGLASYNIGPEEIGRLVATTDLMNKAIARLDPSSFEGLNQEFHSVIYGCCQNAALIDMISDLTHRLEAVRRTVFRLAPYRGAESVQEHRQLIALFADGAPAFEIEAVAREHTLNAVRSFHSWHLAQ